jgi:hypothetical protein
MTTTKRTARNGIVLNSKKMKTRGSLSNRAFVILPQPQNQADKAFDKKDAPRNTSGV